MSCLFFKKNPQWPACPLGESLFISIWKCFSPIPTRAPQNKINGSRGELSKPLVHLLFYSLTNSLLVAHAHVHTRKEEE